MRYKAAYSKCPVCGSEGEKTTSTLDGHFLKKDLYKHLNGECHVDVVYLESPAKRVSILTMSYASQDLLMEAFVNCAETEILSARARELVPAISIREGANLALMKDLPFEPRDVSCDCGAHPGQLCYIPKECVESRVQTLESFLIWLAEQRHRQTKRLTKKLIIDVAEMLGYNTAENLYYKGDGVVITPWATHDHWRLYVGGKLDPTKSIWMTRRSDLTNPERGPLRDEKELALAMRAVGRGE